MRNSIAFQNINGSRLGVLMSGTTPMGLAVSAVDLDSYIAQQEASDAQQVGSGPNGGAPTSVSSAQSGYVTMAQRYCTTYGFACAGYDANSIAQKYAQKLGQDVTALDASNPSINYLTGWALFLKASGMPYAAPQAGGLLSSTQAAVVSTSPSNALQSSVPTSTNPIAVIHTLPGMVHNAIAASAPSGVPQVPSSTPVGSSTGNSSTLSTGAGPNPALSQVAHAVPDYQVFLNDLQAGSYQTAFFTDTIFGIPAIGVVAGIGVALFALTTKGKK